MVYIIPFLHQAKIYNNIIRFQPSQYKDVEILDGFAFQERKKVSKMGKPTYRIIMRHGKEQSYYEIAYGNNYAQIVGREWHYVKFILPGVLPPNLPPKTKASFLVAHFTCFAVQKDNATLEDYIMMKGTALDKKEDDIRRQDEERKSETDTDGVISPSSPSRKNRQIAKGDDSHTRTSSGLSKGYSLASSIIPLRGLSVIMVVATVLNLALCLLRGSSVNNFLLSLVACNGCVLMVVLFGVPVSVGVCTLKKTSSNDNKKDKEKNTGFQSDASWKSDDAESSDDDEDSKSDEDDADESKDAASKKLPSGVKIEAMKYSQMAPAADRNCTNGYSRTLGASWEVRTGPDYATNKKKAASGPIMFDLLGVEAFRTEQKVIHIAKHLDLSPLLKRKPVGFVSSGHPVYDQAAGPLPNVPGLPREEGIDENGRYDGAMESMGENEQKDAGLRRRSIGCGEEKEGGGNIPLSSAGGPSHQRTSSSTGDYFDSKYQKQSDLGVPGSAGFDWDSPWFWVVCMVLPGYPPAMFGGKTDGPGWSCISYFTPSKQTREELKKDKSAINSYNVLKQFLTLDFKSTSAKATTDRMKGLSRIINYKEVPDLSWAVSSALNSYNGKPFLARPQHSYWRGQGYIEIDVDIHQFCYAARNTLSGVLDKFPELICDSGLVIEAYGDEEQPEQVLCCTRIFRIQSTTAAQWEDVIKKEHQQHLFLEGKQN